MKSTYRWIKRTTVGIILSGMIVVGLIAYGYPAVTATLCASCYGMEAVTPRLIVDKEMPAMMRETLSTTVMAAESRVRQFYGAPELAPTIVACSSDECDRRMGGRGALALTLTTPFATITRVSPRGQQPVILTHEFSHIELHRRIGWWKLVNGAVPAWFDEGIAVIVSNDGRYLKSGTTSAERCMRESESLLPERPAEWAARAGKDRMIYADAACRVLQWMDAHDGRDGLMKAIDAVSEGYTSVLP
ncbi:hypothetical protein IM817_12750 [Serratia marcescens]|uniref:hypothetical protein n=1 Tax=Serratia marcescens TaxID=615 RepID=UPI001C5690C6|nr:hypothetical protein [Serratia marcescens]QXX98980.1 hypothetical protein IM817_12750 [Serratia marcescens]